MAPEMYEENYGPGCDIYAFGMAVLEMVTNQTPYKECANPAQIYKKVMNGKHPASLEFIQDEEVKSFILMCIAEEQKRPTAQELINSKYYYLIFLVFLYLLIK